MQESRIKTKMKLNKYIFVFILYSLFFTPLFAQSNLTYELKVAATGSVRLLDEFPESYAAEKVNIRIQPSAVRFAGFRFYAAGSEPFGL